MPALPYSAGIMLNVPPILLKILPAEFVQAYQLILTGKQDEDPNNRYGPGIHAFVASCLQGMFNLCITFLKVFHMACSFSKPKKKKLRCCLCYPNLFWKI